MISKSTMAPETIRRSSARVAYYDASLPVDLAEMLWKQPQELTAGGEILQRAGHRQTVRLRWAAQHYVLKHYGESSWLDSGKRAVQPSRAYTTWAASRRLVAGGIPTPCPVACVENRWGPLRRDSFLMYRYVEGENLRRYFAGELGDSNLENFRQQLFELWRKLRELRVSLTDTQLRNFIVCPARKIWVIDLDRTRFHRSPIVAAHYQQRAWNRLMRSVATAEKLRLGAKA